MILVLDIGNSSITAGLYENETLQKITGFSYQNNSSIPDFEKFFQQLANIGSITECVAASVAGEVTFVISDAITNLYGIKPFFITSEMQSGIKIEPENAEKIGIDRIANVYEACRLYSEPVIVVDFGTATTFDITDGKYNFTGGIIMPGIGTQLKSLSENTSKLKQPDLEEIKNVKKTINTNTEKAILSGVIKGHAHAVDGLITDCIKEIGKKPILIATGGLAPLVTKYIKYKFDKTDAQLTIRGLYGLYKLNND